MKATQVPDVRINERGPQLSPWQWNESEDLRSIWAAELSRSADRNTATCEV